MKPYRKTNSTANLSRSQSPQEISWVINSPLFSAFNMTTIMIQLPYFSRLILSISFYFIFFESTQNHQILSIFTNAKKKKLF